MRLLVAAGASGGGVYPALAVLQELADKKASGDKDVDLLWVGGEGGMETELVSRAGYKLIALPAAGLHTVGLPALPGNLWRLMRGYFAARRVLRDFKPDVLFFTGGFVAAPMALAGGKVPTLAFVPDIKPGFTLRFIARFADKIAVVAEEARQYFSQPERVVVTGYPVRKEISRWKRSEARKHFKLSNDLRVLLVFGGSKGARTINEAVIRVLTELLKDMQIIHISGAANWGEVQAAYARLPRDMAANYRAFPYLHDDMGGAFAAADLALCRAGASTLGELPLFGLPAVLVPIPLRGHLQAVNASYLRDRGAAVILPDEKMATELVSVVRGLMQDETRLEKMRAAMSSLAAPNAAKQIAAMLRSLGTEAKA